MAIDQGGQPSLSEAVRAGVDADALKARIEQAGGPERALELSDALCEAAMLGRPEAIPLLIEAGAQADHQSEQHGSKTPLILALEHDKKDAVSALLEGGAKPDAVDGNSGWAPLHWAASQGCSGDSVAELVDAGADINVLTPDNSTALHLAAGQGHKEICKLLVELEVDHDKVNALGVSAMGAAISGGHREAAIQLSRQQVSVSHGVTSDMVKQLLRWQAQEAARLEQMIQEKDREREQLVNSIPERCAHAASVIGTPSVSRNKISRTS